MPTPHKIYAQIGTSTNRQTFNKRFATSEKSPISQSHKSYKIPLAVIDYEKESDTKTNRKN